MKFVLGVDEAGRGPLAGPVAVGVVMVPAGYDVRKKFPGVADSKVLSPKKREELYALLLKRAKSGEVEFCVRFRSAAAIDRRGIVRAVESAVHSGVRRLAPNARSAKVLLDGLLHAPAEYEQKTIIGGDASVPLIALASIAAKVRRDRLMRRYEKDFPQYAFVTHKGYGTKQHYKLIKKHGLSAIHRRTYLGFTRAS